MKFRSSSHSVYKTEYHLVWIPRYRRKIFVSGVKQYAETILNNVSNLEPDIEVIKVNVQLDHIHMVIVIPPRVAVANVVGYIKSQSAKQLKAKFPFLEKVYHTGDGIWSRGYCVSSIGFKEKEILAYVEHQNHQDRGQQQILL